MVAHSLVQSVIHMAIGEVKYSLPQGKFLAKRFRESATADIPEDRKDHYFAGYMESFLMHLAVHYPEVRREMEERVIYRDINK